MTDVAISLAGRWLEANPSQLPERCDVAATLALALCDRAGAKLLQLEEQQQQPEGAPGASIVSACEDLEAALILLQSHDKSERLQRQIEDALRMYRGRCVLELLALPLPLEEGQGKGVEGRGWTRARGLQLLQEAVADVTEGGGASPGQPDRQLTELLAKARLVMTAKEQVSWQW